MECLRRLASIPRSRNKLTCIDYDKIIYHKVQYLTPSYNEDVLFELPPSCVSASTPKNTMDSMDKWFNGHTQCCSVISNICNILGFIFRKSSYNGQLFCNNQNCDFLYRSSKRNEVEWFVRTINPFNLRHSPLPDSS